MSFDYASLITDRARSDSDTLKALLAKPLTDWTEAERTAFNGAVMRGSYDYTGLNRVDACLEDLVARLGRVGCNVPGYERLKIERETKPAKEENFRYLRIIVNALRGNTTVFQVSEIKILSKTGESMPWPAETLVTSTMKETSEAESPKKLIDGSVETKFCSVHFSPGAQINIDLKSNILDRKEYTSWQWFTANDSPERDPVSFELQGSADGSDFFTLDSVTNASITTTRNILAYTGNFQKIEPEQPPMTLDPYTWYESDVLTVSLLARYRANVTAVRRVFRLPEGTPEVPATLRRMTQAEANSIEAVLLAVDLILDHIPAAVRHCGVTVCGGKGVRA
mgnify:FL=1